MNISRTLAGTLLAVHAVFAVAEPSQALQSGGGLSPAQRLQFEGEPSPDQLLAEISVRHQFPPEADLVQVRGGASALSGLEYERYELRLAGIPLHGHGLTLHTREGRVVGAFGRVPARPVAQTTPQLTEAQARTAVQRAVAAELGRPLGGVSWAPASPCRLSLRDSGTTTTRRQYRLYYRCVVDPVTPDGFAQLGWIDAATGTVRELVPQVLHYQAETWHPALCSGETVYHGMVSDLPCYREEVTGRHRFESLSAVAIRTEGYGGRQVPPTGPVYESPSSAFFDITDEPGVSVYWGVQTGLQAIERYFGMPMRDLLFERLTTAGSPPPLRAYVEAPDPGAYTALNPARMVFGIEDGTKEPGFEGTHYVALNVVGHELGHVLAVHAADLMGTKDDDEGAIGESFADIMGELAEEMAGLPGGADWLTSNPPLQRRRDLADPLESLPKLQVAGQMIPGAPDVWDHPDWHVYQQVDKPHLPSLVHSRWFYLLAHGGSGTNSSGKPWSVRGVGLEEAVRFLSTSIFEILPPAPTFPDARNSSVQAVSEACGEFSEARIANHNAWDAVNLFPSPLPLTHGLTVPAHQAMGVAPWPATLFWQAKENDTETAWHVEIGTNPSFDGALATSSSESDTAAGFLAGRIELELKPATRYYWRVRRADVDPTLKSCWRPARSFVTSDQVPTPVSPIHGQHHPWKLPFRFARVEGATHYQIEVARDPDFADRVFPIKTFPADSASAPGDVPPSQRQIELTLPVGQEVLYWRVRSQYSPGTRANQMYSAWSQPKSFGTTTPRATLSSPADNAQVYPWPVEFVWQEVRGATYTLAVDSIHEHMEPDHRTFPNLPEAEPRLRVNLRAYWVSHIGEYKWSVSLLGPPWGSEIQPEPASTREEGDPSPVRQVRIDGNDTLVDPVSPKAITTSKACFAFQAPVTFIWQPVSGATDYLLEIFELECRPGHYCLPTDRLVHRQFYHQTYQVTLTQGNHGPIAGPFSVPDNIGYAWRVWAATAEGFPSADAHHANYHVRPTRPDPRKPGTQEDLPPGEVLFEWRSDVAHGGGFFFELHERAGCSDLDYSRTVQSPEPGDTTGTIVSSDDWRDPARPVPQSWRVRPFVYNVCDAPPLWSICVPFRVVPPEPDPPLEAPGVVPEYGATIGIYFVFEKMPWASLYHLMLHEGSPAGPLVAAQTYTINQLRDERERLESGPLAPYGLPEAMWFYQYSVPPVPSINYYYRVKACSTDGSCSGWSEWSNFFRMLPWPFNPPIEPES